MAIADKLTELQATKTAIKKAVEGQGQDLTDVPFTQYADKIRAIQSGSGASVGGDKAKEIVLKTVTKITPQDIDDIGFTQINNYTFYNCTSLQSFKLSDTQNVPIWSSVFEGCTSLTDVTVWSFVGGASSVFKGCTSLSKVKWLRDFKMSGNDIFSGCNTLSVLDFRSLTSIVQIGDKTFRNAKPADCVIVVPDDLYESWCIASNWADLPRRSEGEGKFTFVKARDYKE